MCYDVKTLTKKQLKYAESISADTDEIARLKKILDVYVKKPIYHSSGFDHPNLPILRNFENKNLELFNWGLVPQAYTDKTQVAKINNKTLLARAETIFETQSYKNIVPQKRCIIMVDGYFEHHHILGKTIPFFIEYKNENPMFFAGIYNVSEVDGNAYNSCSIITVEANDLMRKIHNNPKADGARMPLILENESFEYWLNSKFTKKEELNGLFNSLESDKLKAKTVTKLRNNGDTNLATITDLKSYNELPYGLDSIGKLNIQLEMF